MTSLLQQSLGGAWDQLPPALQAHYLPGKTLDIGHMDIEYSRWMQPVLIVLSCLGALVRRRGKAVQTSVEKSVVGQRQHWHRTLRYADGQTLHFDSVSELAPNGDVVEYVNPWLGLQMKPRVNAGLLHYRGVWFVLRLGRWTLHIPEGLALGHTTIVEQAVDEHHFAMDFRLTHPVFGQVFRYSGTFRSNAGTLNSGHLTHNR
jgi:Domain of unknown function (DUF4166)